MSATSETEPSTASAVFAAARRRWPWLLVPIVLCGAVAYAATDEGSGNVVAEASVLVAQPTGGEAAALVQGAPVATVSQLLPGGSADLVDLPEALTEVPPPGLDASEILSSVVLEGAPRAAGESNVVTVRATSDSEEAARALADAASDSIVEQRRETDSEAFRRAVRGLERILETSTPELPRRARFDEIFEIRNDIRELEALNQTVPQRTRVISRAGVTQQAVVADRERNLVAGLLAGLLLGLVIAVVRDRAGRWSS